MPIEIKSSGSRKDSPAQAMAKGKLGKSYVNELFAQVDEFMYEFGIIDRAKSKKPTDD